MSKIADEIYKNAKIYSVALDGAETEEYYTRTR